MSVSALQHFRSDRRLAALSGWAVVLALLAQLVLMPLLPAAAAAAGEHAICLAVGNGAPAAPADAPAGDHREHCPLCRLTAAAVLPPAPPLAAAPVTFAAVAFASPLAAHPVPVDRTGLAQPRAPPAL